MGDEDYWSGVVPPATWVAMACKYDALEQLASMSDTARADALRRAACAWPGAVREAELAGPQVCALRRTIARANLSRPARTRRAWSEDEHARAVLWWAELHLMLCDQLAFRARGGGDAAAFVGGLDAGARARWPDAERLIQRGGAKVRPRQAYLWLAARSGTSLAELNRGLFARAGHWDHRDDDPEWTRIG